MAWPANSLIEVRVEYVVNLQKCMNVFHYEPFGDSEGFSIPQLTEAFATANAGPGNGTWGAELARVMSASSIVTRVSTQLVYPQRWRSFEVVLAINGSRTGDPRAQNVQASLTKFGLMATRHDQGGMRIGGISIDDYNQGLITAGFKTALEVLVGHLMIDRSDNITTADYSPSIANKVKVPNTNPPKYVFSGGTVITNWIIENQLRTQRSRTVGRGE